MWNALCGNLNGHSTLCQGCPCVPGFVRIWLLGDGDMSDMVPSNKKIRSARDAKRDNLNDLHGGSDLWNPIFAGICNEA